MSDLFSGKNKIGREIIYDVNEELIPPIEKSYSDLHPLLKRELFEDPTSQNSIKFFTIQDPIQLSNINITNQHIIIGELFGMCSDDEIINKQQTSTANDFERLAGILLKDDPEARIVNKYLAVKSFQRSDASRVFHKELVRSVTWCRMVVRRLLVYFLEADREKLNYLYQKPSGNNYKYIDIYNFLRDRLRAVWQDLTVQHATRHRGSIDCYEISFRFLLFSEEYLSNSKEFNSVQNGSLMSTCLGKLMSGYMDVIYTKRKFNIEDDFLNLLVYESPYQAEFWSYRILTSMSINIKDVNDTRIIDIINSLNPELINHPLIQLSLGIHCSFRLINIVRYFRYFRKCYDILLSILNPNSNSIQDPYIIQLKQYSHSLILICILIKKYSNIIRLKYLNIILSSNMNRRQLLPLDQFIEIFGFYIESIESLRLFTERFEIKIFSKEDHNLHLFKQNIIHLYSIHQLKDIKIKFVVSFKDCINLSSSIESLSILNSLTWPSESLINLLKNIPRIDILDPINKKIYFKNSDFKSKNNQSYDKIHTNQNQFNSCISLNSKNRDIINSKFDIPNKIIKNMQDIDINKLKFSNKRRIDNTDNLDSKIVFYSDDINDLDTYSFKKRMLNQNKKEINYNNQEDINKNNYNENIIDNYEDKYQNQINQNKSINLQNNDQNNNINIKNNQKLNIEDNNIKFVNYEYKSKYIDNKEDVSLNINNGINNNNIQVDSSNNKNAHVNNGIITNVDNNDEEIYIDSEISVNIDYKDNIKDYFNLNNKSNELYSDFTFEENLVGISKWKKNKKIFESQYNFFNRIKNNTKKDISNNIIEETNYYRNILLSKINLPSDELGINEWLNDSIENILNQISNDIISKILDSLKFNFIFFYNQLVNTNGISRSHVNNLSKFYTKIELLLSNLTNKILSNSQLNNEFLFPWNTVIIESNSGQNIIIDIYESYSIYINNHNNQLNQEIPIHIEMLSVWLNYNNNSLRNQLFSNIDFSIINEKKLENLENKEIQFEELIHEYLANNGDIIVWGLPFLLQTNDSLLNDNIIRNNRNNFDESDYIRKSINSFAINISIDEGRKQLIDEFEYCCNTLNIKKYNNVEFKIPILKTITVIFSFVIYIPNNLSILLDDFNSLRQEIETLEKRLEDLINKEYLQENNELIIADNDLIIKNQDKDLLLISYSGISCLIQFKCIGFTKLDSNDVNQELFSIYNPGLNSLINSKLNLNNFSNNIVLSNNSIQILKIDSLTFISTLFIRNYHIVNKDNISLFEIFKNVIREGFISIFNLFKKGNIDWIFLFSDYYYSDIKEIIVWIYNLYIHCINCLENKELFLDNDLNKIINNDFSDNIFEFSKLSLKLFNNWIKLISDSYDDNLNLSQIVWNMLFDHFKPIGDLSKLDYALEIIVDSFLNLINSRREQLSSKKDVYYNNSKNLIELIDEELLNYKVFNYLNRFVLSKINESN